MIKKKLAVLIGGGSGGHIFPGLTIAYRLITYGWQVRWIGAFNRIESELVPKYNIDIDFIRISGFCGKKIHKKIISLFQIFPAIYQARRIILSWKPNIVLGMGGYVSGPCGIAAWICGIPFLLHEQNCIAGITNRCLSRIAYKTLQAFPETLPNAITVGNPVCDTILAIPKPEQRLYNRYGPIRVLVIGGSQGAKILNQIMPIAAKKISKFFIFWHQTGKESVKNVNKAYLFAGVKKYKIVEFIDNIAVAYNWADIIICRSGALTISEISAAGLPSLLVPFIHKDRQQYLNAQFLEKKGAAIIIEESRFTATVVSEILISLNRTVLLSMAKKARKSFLFFNATEKIVSEIILAARI